MKKSEDRSFRCERCDVKFSALVQEHEAGCCPKCKDTEWVVKIPNPTYWQMD